MVPRQSEKNEQQKQKARDLGILGGSGRTLNVFSRKEELLDTTWGFRCKLEREREREEPNAFSPAVELAPSTQGCSPSKICFPRMGNGPAACRIRLCPVSDGEEAAMYRRQEALRVPGG